MNRRIYNLTGTIAMLLLLTSLLPAQITLHDDFDGASLDVANSNVDGSVITLAPRASWNDPNELNFYRTVTFRVEGVAGQTPRFRLYRPPLVFEGRFRSRDGSAYQRFVYSTDGEQWQFFDNHSGNRNDYRFSNSEPFVADSVFVSWGIPYPVGRARAFVEEIAVASPHVRPSSSADDQFVLGYGSGGTDDLGRTIAPQELLGVRITDDRIVAAEKRVVLVVGGNHSGETNGNLTLEGFVRFAISNHPRAVELRERVELLFYPIVNPDGRFAGYYRSGPENPTLDYNRYWNDPSGFTDLTIVRNAMIADTGGSADMLLDFHCHFTPGKEHFLYASDISNTGYIAALRALRPNLGLKDIGLDRNAPPEGFLDSWAAHPLGLGAEFVGSAEPCPSLTEQEYFDLGRDYALALVSYLPNSDSDGDQIPDYWERTFAPDLATFSTSTDTDGDGRSDRDEWMAATDPTSGASFFQPSVAPGGSGGAGGGENIRITWQGHAGRTYRVESSSSLDANSWMGLDPAIEGIDGTMSTTVSRSATGRAFFRIKTLPRQ